MAVLTKLVFKVTHCIQKKPGEPCLPCQTRCSGSADASHGWWCGGGVPGVVVVRTLVVHRGTGPGHPVPLVLKHFRHFGCRSGRSEVGVVAVRSEWSQWDSVGLSGDTVESTVVAMESTVVAMESTVVSIVVSLWCQCGTSFLDRETVGISRKVSKTRKSRKSGKSRKWCHKRVINGVIKRHFSDIS